MVSDFAHRHASNAVEQITFSLPFLVSFKFDFNHLIYFSFAIYFILYSFIILIFQKLLNY